MPKGGWIPLWRKIWDTKFSPRTKRRPYTEFEAWLDLLCRAVQNPEGTMVKGTGMMPVRLEPGEILCSYRGLQADWRWGSHHKVRRYCAALCILEMIEISSHNPTRLKIVNAELYGLVRPKDRDNGVPEASHERPTHVPIQQDKQVIKKDKQVIKKKKKKGVAKESDPHFLSPKDFLEYWNAAGFQKAHRMTSGRLKHLKARMADDDWRGNWKQALVKLKGIPFARGDNDRGWIADIDFFLRPDSVTKILEGKYDGRNGPKGNKGGRNFDDIDYDDIPEDLR